MWRPGKFVARVSLNRQIHVYDIEEHLGECMAVQEGRVQCCEEAEAQHLPDTCVFCCQRKGGRVDVVLLVEDIQPGHLVMQQMPQTDLHVEQEEAGQYILKNRLHLGCQRRKRHRSQVPMHNRNGENEADVVVEDFEQAPRSHCQCHLVLRLDLEAAYQGES